MKTLFVSRLFMLSAVALLASCAGTASQSGPGRYASTPAENEAIRIAELHPRPARVASVNGEAYRCVGEMGTETVKISGSEWYFKNDGDHGWQPAACNRGEHNNGKMSILSVCGASGLNAWAVTTERSATSSSSTHRMFSSDTQTLKILVRNADKDSTSYATCKRVNG